MQKKVIALAVAGLVSGAAFAQSNVTIYGVVDAAYVYSKSNSGFTQDPAGIRTPVSNTPGYSSTNKFSGVFSGGWDSPRVGFKGEENLGGGLKAIFQMEFGTDIDGDKGLSKTRKSFVGLSGNFGTITAGRLYAPGADTLDNTAMDGATFSPMQTMGRSLSANKIGLDLTDEENKNLTGLVGTTMGGGSITRWNNAIGFESKKYAGFSAKAVYAFGETGNNTGIKYASNASSSLDNKNENNTATAKTTDNGRFGLKVAYANGPLNVDVIYHKLMNIRGKYPDTNSAINIREGGDINEWYIGGGYDFKVVKLLATYQQTRSDYSTKAGEDAAGNIDMNLWSLGAIVPIGANGKLRFEYGNVQYDQSAKSVPNALLRKDGGSTGIGIGYTHNLSKRTMLYGLVSRVDNDKNSFPNGGDGKDAFTSTPGEVNYTYMMGVSHKF